MRFFCVLKICAWLVVGLTLAGGRAEAQQYLGLGATASADAVLVGNSLTYTITVTNLSGITLTDLRVTNTLLGSIQFVGANSPYGVFTNYGNVAVFDLGPYSDGQISQLTLTVQPTVVEALTNQIVAYAIDFTNTASVSLVTQATNVVVLADLGVVMSASTVPVITNDIAGYSVSVTNAGPDDAAGVFLTNTLPPGAILKGVSPASQAYTVAGSNVLFNLGTLTNGGARKFQLSYEPTNAGTLTFSAAIAAAGVTDLNPTNNFASTNVTVIAYPPSQLVAVTNSGQIVNHQNGLIEQSILVSNVGTNDVGAVRLVVTGLTNRLFNASGTNSGNPFVVYATTLATNSSVTLLLQYAPRLAFPFTNSQLQANAVPKPDLTPPPVSLSSTNLVISQIIQLANGNMLIEFPSTLGRSYSMVYSDNVLFSNAMIAPPAFVAPADVTGWIDYGPPATISAPSNSPARFYRVIQNP